MDPAASAVIDGVAAGAAGGPSLRYLVVGLGEVEADGVPLARGATRLELVVEGGGVELVLASLGGDGRPLAGRELRLVAGPGVGFAEALARLAAGLAALPPR